MSEAGEGLPYPQRLWAILTIAMASSLAVLDGPLVNIALPVISADLKVTAAASIWVANAYQLAITVAVMAAAVLGDIVGYRRIYSCGIALFTVASLGCAMSRSLEWLIFWRVLHGLGGAGIFALNGALLRHVYPRGRIGQGMSINATAVAASSAAGPTLAAAILAMAPWPFLFIVNVPLGLFALWVSRHLPDSRGVSRRFDWVGALLNAIFFGLTVTALDGVGRGEGRWIAVAEAVAAAGVLWLLVRNQRGKSFSFLPLDLFAKPVFALSALVATLGYAAVAMTLVALPFLFGAHGFSTAQTGLLISPWPIGTALCAPLVGRLSDRVPGGILCSIGLGLLIAGLVLVGLAPVDATIPDMAWRMLIGGIGYGTFQTPNNRMLLTAAPPDRSGASNGVMSSARLFGQSAGAALVAAVFGLTASRGVAFGSELALTLAACSALAGMTVSLVRLKI
jgi:MFS transporter, DHA2 family, multidrug resistance protein